MGQSHPTPTGSHPNSAVQDTARADSAQKFTYAPLAHPRSFRILRLTHKYSKDSAGWEDAVLNGSIIDASLDQVPEYFALSYTWGNSSLDDKILIDGRVLRITQNCADALRRMLKGKFKRMLWVDSICINQADDAQALQERGRQVALMDEIYSKARQVNVHLGFGDEKSDVAIATVNRLATAYLPALVAKNSGIGQELTRRRYEEAAADALAISAEFPYGKLHGLFRLPWFRRTWVVQEIALARKVTFYCGQHLLAFDNVAKAVDFTRLPYSKVDLIATHWKSYLAWHHSLAGFVRRHDQGEDFCKVPGFGLQYLLAGTVMLDAARPEDKVYGLYGCAKRLGLKLPVPDYTKSVAQVYTEATLACLQQAENLDVLEMVEGSAAAQFGLPSWVPNLSSYIRRWTPTDPPKTGSGPMRTNKAVSGMTQCHWMIEQDQPRLKVCGRRLDLVVAVSEPWRTDARTTLLGDSPTNTGQFYDSLLACVVTWLEVVTRGQHIGSGHEAIAVDEDAAVQHLVRLIVNAHAHDPLIGPPPLMAEYFSLLVECARSINRGLLSYLDFPEDEIAMKLVIVYLLTASSWRLVFRTGSTAYLGIGSYSCQPQDLVVVFHGMATPSVIRPCAGGFNFVGTAFVDGIMEGEFWNAGSEADDEWFLLI
ncbi:hypothetical protein LTR10_003431 [Elasticomyces elasticus]|nr:hypothetical protein LTR10_003431 [Elasticomyces elasticus]KAK4969699.1 hypothetical protein LTR42_008971 [Elasticomyces elasticus]